MKRTLLLILMMTALTLSDCVMAGGSQSTREEPLPVPDISDLKPEWIKNDCNDTRMVYAKYQLCLAYIASQLPSLDLAKREYFGEQYSPKTFLQCALKGRPIDGACEKYRLRRVENPEYWPYPDVPKPKWPDAPKEIVYKPGMSSKEYFEALCKAEAGEFIYKTVENVEGIYQVRPLTRNEDQNNDLYVIEDPYGIDYPSATVTALNFLMSGRYQFFESPIQSGDVTKQMIKKIERFFGSDGSNSKTLKREYEEVPKARYAYTWRGIHRPHDREMEIAGGELALLDLQTNEILALRRGFVRRDYIPHTLPQKSWGAGSCPQRTPVPLFLMKAAKPIAAGTNFVGDSK